MSAIARPGHFSNGLVATSGGLAPRGSHAGLRPSQRPDFQKRQHLPSEDAVQNMERNTAGARAAAGARPSPGATGRRHFDPHHYTNLSDEAKRQEGRLGRAHGRPPQPNLTVRTFNQPGGAAEAQPQRARHRGTDTSVQLAEARLRRVANGRASEGGDPDKSEAYREAARSALEQFRGDAAIVQQEQALQHRMASDAFARAGAAQRAAESATPRGDRAEGGLGSPAPRLQTSTPFALADSAPRVDTDTTVTGGHGVRVNKNHNRDHRPITGGAGPTPAGADDAGRDSEHLRADAEEARRRGNEKYYAFRGMAGGRPYDDAAAAGDRYPTPPPVGESVGIYQRHRMVRASPRGNAGGPYAPGPDADSIALARARARAAQNARAKSESASMDRPEFFAPRLEQPAEGAAEGAKRRVPATLRERTEARWRREEDERDSRRTGRARVGHHNAHTPLW